MKDMMEYKGYYGSVHYSDDDRLFYGKVQFIKALVSYDGKDVDSLRAGFKEAIDDYIDLCHSQDIEPEHSFKGSFNVRVGSDLHRRASLYTQERGTTLNHLIKHALDEHLKAQHF